MEEIAEYRVQLASDYLESVRALKRRKDAAAALAEEFTGIRGIDYQREHVASSTDDDMLVYLVEKRKERKAALDASVAEYDDMASDAWRRIQMLKNDAHVQLLTFRYLKDMSWDDVAFEMRYSYQHVMELRRVALFLFYDLLPSDCKAPRTTSE